MGYNCTKNTKLSLVFIVVQMEPAIHYPWDVIVGLANDVVVVFSFHNVTSPNIATTHVHVTLAI